MKRNKKVLVAAVATLIVAGGLTSAGLVFAATNNSPNVQESFMTRVAQILGVSDQKLTNALQQASTENVDQLLKNGKITQIQADQMKQKIQSGKFKNLDIGFGRMGINGIRFDYISSLAQYTGINKTDLNTALKAKKNLTDIITSNGKTISDTKAYLIQQETTNIQQKLKDGKITQDEANNFTKDLSVRTDDFLNGNFTGFHLHSIGGNE